LQGSIKTVELENENYAGRKTLIRRFELEILKRFKKVMDEQVCLLSQSIAIKLLEVGEKVPPKTGQ